MSVSVAHYTGRVFRSSLVAGQRSLTRSTCIQTTRQFTSTQRAYSAPSGLASQLLAQIQTNTQKYLAHIASQSLPEPSFEHGNGLDPAIPLPQEIEAARQAALEATDELHFLLLGPHSTIADCPGNQYLMLALQYIYRYKIQYQVPTDGSEISFADIAQATDLNEKDVARFLRVAVARHVFHEPRKNYIKHTAASRLLLNNTLLEHWVVNIAEDFWPSVSRMVDATEKWPGSEEPNESGYSLAYNTTENPFDVIRKDPKMQERFINAMKFSHMHSAYNMSHLLSTYDFSNVKTLVDVGGSHGSVSIALAKQYPEISCVVQDLPDTIAGLSEHIPSELSSRVTGMPHDFLTPQPIKDADVYLLRWILHDWSDKYCVKILRNLIPALKKGARVVVNDICIPEPGMLPIAQERGLRLMDISMKAFNNARERDAESWVGLFQEADSRFKFLGIRVPPGANMAIIEAEWTG